MQYLSIRNPGVADYRGLTVLGVSTTRESGMAGTVGTFGSGSKLSIGLLLRHGIEPMIICGNLKMNFFTRVENVQGKIFNRVCVKYSGKDLSGQNKSSTEDLGFVSECGVHDWKHLSMALREFVSNAIDGSILAGGSHESVNFEIVDTPRAKAGHTTVFIPYTPEIAKVYSALDVMFLHFKNADLLKAKCLPKREDAADSVLIYKKGVLVHSVKGKSVFDYNLGDELTLDESRNASDSDVRYAVAQALKDESADNLVKILGGVIEGDCWEGSLDSYYLTDTWATPQTKARRENNFKEAWLKVAGPKGVVNTTGSASLASFVVKKGYTPVGVGNVWGKTLAAYKVMCESDVLTQNEMDGKVVSDATPDMISCTKRVWELLKAFNLTNGKEMPGVKGFTSIMDGGCQTWGYYIPGGNDIYLHTSLGVGKMMFKVALEEIVHYCTGSADNSRDLQDFLFNMVTEMSY